MNWLDPVTITPNLKFEVAFDSYQAAKWWAGPMQMVVEQHEDHLGRNEIIS
jgi:hypothetical protein